MGDRCDVSIGGLAPFLGFAVVNVVSVSVTCGQPVEWRERALSSGFGHAMAHDTARGVTVVFGGHGSSHDNRMTWEWAGERWSLRASGGPSRRRQHSMAYDSARGRTVLFGGCAGDQYVCELPGDTWEWDGTAWL